MREFYRQVSVDRERLRFYAWCPGCTGEQPGRKLPYLCRGRQLLPQLAAGTASPGHQRRYNKARAAAVQDLARHFNFCRSCGSWMCNHCFCADNPEGVCKQCEAEQEREETI